MFYKKGWKGINIEPQQREYARLVRDRKRDINLNVGVADKPGKLKLRQYKNESLSTFSDTIKEDYETNKSQIGLDYQDKDIEVRTLKDIFLEYKVKSIQFLKVDVEGFEYEVLKGNDWTRYRPEILCIEANNMVKAQAWQAVVDEANYIKVYFDGLNEYYVAEEVSYRIEQFRRDYQKLIVSVPALSFDWDIMLNKIVKQLEKVQTALDHQRVLNQSLESQLSASRVKQESPRFLIKQLSRSVQRRLKGSP
jgi:FkbM family methyltransferase